MAKYLTTIFILIALTLGGCRTDGGDIGYLYGQWALRELTIDDKVADIDLENYYLMFQGKIVFIKVVKPMHDFENILGTWEREDHELLLNFTQTMTDPNTGETIAITPPAELGIPSDEIARMRIVKLTDSELILTYTDPQGAHLRYVFEKLK